jgi:hypothetical protein
VKYQVQTGNVARPEDNGDHQGLVDLVDLEHYVELKGPVPRKQKTKFFLFLAYIFSYDNFCSSVQS